MNNKTVSNLGFIGISLLLFTLIFGGQLIENYDITNQFISESYAIDLRYWDKWHYNRLKKYLKNRVLRNWNILWIRNNCYGNLSL